MVVEKAYLWTWLQGKEWKQGKKINRKPIKATIVPGTGTKEKKKINASDNWLLLQWEFCQISLIFEWKLSDFLFQREASAAALINEQGELATLKLSKAATVIKTKPEFCVFLFM